MRTGQGARPVSTSPQEAENTNVGHARFIAEASKRDRWRADTLEKGLSGADSGEDFDSLVEGKGACALRPRAAAPARW